MIREKKGITLVAMVITIIVMLILLGVTISVSLKGNLFGITKKTANDTNKEEEREELNSAVAMAYEKKTSTVNKSKLENILGEDWSVSEAGELYGITSPRGNGFTIRKNGDISEYTGIILSSSEVVIDKVGKTAVLTATLIGIEGDITWNSSNENIATISPENSKATITALKEGIMKITVKCADDNAEATIKVEDPEVWQDNGDGTYTRNDVTVERGKTIYTTAEVREKLGMEPAKEGEYNSTWRVIGISGNKLKLVSTYKIGSGPILGYSDEMAEGADSYEKAKNSYIGAVDRLNNYVIRKTGIPCVRSINIEDIYEIIGKEEIISSQTDYGKKYKYYCNDETNGKIYYSVQNSNGTYGTSVNTGKNLFNYVNDNKEITTINSSNKGEVVLTDNSISYKFTTAQKALLGSLATGYYWLNSPYIKCREYVTFGVLSVNGGEILGDTMITSHNFMGNPANDSFAIVLY